MRIKTLNQIAQEAAKYAVETLDIDPPPRPKRKVKKVVEGWVNIYPVMEISGFIYGTQKEARALRSAHHLGDPLYIKHEYEVEEWNK